MENSKVRLGKQKKSEYWYLEAMEKNDKYIAGIVVMSPIECWKAPTSWNYRFNIFLSNKSNSVRIGMK